MVAELIVDTPISDPYTWQTAQSLAETLNVTVRTIRGWIHKGKTEKTRSMDGNVYYRLKREEPKKEKERDDREGDPRSSGSSDPFPEATQIEFMREIQSLTAKHMSQVVALHERIAGIQKANGELETIAEFAVRDVERVTEAHDEEKAARIEAEKEALRWRQSHEEMTRRLQAEQLRRERAEMYTTMLAATPWWAFSKRSKLKRLAVGVEALESF